MAPQSPRSASTSSTTTTTGRPKRQVMPKVDPNYVYTNNAASSPTKEDSHSQKQSKAGAKRKMKIEPEELTYEFHVTTDGEDGPKIQRIVETQEGIVQIVSFVNEGSEQVVNQPNEAETAEGEGVEAPEDNGELPQADAVYGEVPPNDPEEGESAEAEAVTGEQGGPNATEVDDGTSTVSAGNEDDKDVDFPDGYLPTYDKKLPKKVYMKDPEDPARKFKCPYVGCSYVAKYRSNLWDHKKTHTGEKPYQCTWPDCHMRFSQTHQLKLHTRSHTGERPYKCTWPGCDAAFSQKPGLRSHALTHTGEKNFVCDFPGCNWAFRLKGALTDHKRAIHEDKKAHTCEWPGCGKRFLQSCHLKKHLMAHADIKPYACDWPKCTYKAVTMAYVTNHRRTHTGERNHECNFKGCHKKFVKSSHVNRHRQRCHPEMFLENHDGNFGDQEHEFNEDVVQYGEQPAIADEMVESHDNENLAENDQIVIEYSEQEDQIIIQSGNNRTIVNGQLVEDKDGTQYIQISEDQMIPLQDILSGEALKEGAVQEVYVKEEGADDPEPQTV